MVEFKEWPKIPRGGKSETITITEKIDGTNACVIVEERNWPEHNFEPSNFVVGAQSRNQLLCSRPDVDWIEHSDNYGFSHWVRQNDVELAKLGPGYHYGEWAGPGIQKNPHNLTEKKFFLFNSDRWRDGRQERPAGVECVPVLYEGPANVDGEWEIDRAMEKLWWDAKEKGYHPEGIVVWYHKTRRYEKYTYENAEGKWKAA